VGVLVPPEFHFQAARIFRWLFEVRVMGKTVFHEAVRDPYNKEGGIMSVESLRVGYKNIR